MQGAAISPLSYITVVVLGQSGPSTSQLQGVLRRSPRKQQIMSQVQADVQQVDVQQSGSSTSQLQGVLRRSSRKQQIDAQENYGYVGGFNGENYDSMAENMEGLDEDDMPSDDLHNLHSNSEEDVGDCRESNFQRIPSSKNPIFNEKTDFDNPVRWDLFGFPCVHAIRFLNFLNKDPPKPGRLKKARRREPEEPDPVVLTKRGVKMSCRGCGREGHNKRGCRHKDEWDAYAATLVTDKIASIEKRITRAKEKAAKKVASAKEVAKQNAARRSEKTATGGTTLIDDPQHQQMIHTYLNINMI
ncbi:hypothetical protein Droror1_Dr00026731 [Drosera rotundifolia]